MAKTNKMNKKSSMYIDGEVKIARYDWHEEYSERIILFNAKGEQLVLCFDNWQHCCEDWNLDYDYTIENGRTISEHGVAISWYEDNRFKCDCGGKYIFTVMGDIDSFTISFSNDHNGYYSHTIEILKNGELKWEETL